MKKDEQRNFMSISKDELKAMVAKICLVDVAIIKDDTLLMGELKMDSIKIVELLAILGEEYNIHAAEHDAANFNKFSDFYEFTQKSSQGN